MKSLLPAVAAIAVLAVCNQASAQSSSDILQRLEAVERSNAKLQESNLDLKKENAALRDRVKRVESARQVATAPPIAQPGSAVPKPVSGYAADASMRPVYKAAPPIGVPVAWTWTGFYVGAHGGYAWARATGPDLHIDQQGGFGGIQMGLNYQFWDHWVLGLESDASFADIKGSTSLVCGGGGGGGGGGCDTVGTITIKVDAFGSFRERAGYAWDRVLLYETAGVAWADAKPHIVVTAGEPSQLGTFDDRRLMTGLAGGGGIEFAATPNLTIKAEYLYLDFPAKVFLSGTSQNSPADERIHTVRVGMNWLFH
jgi:outer membrane immunogenic protein